MTDDAAPQGAGLTGPGRIASLRRLASFFDDPVEWYTALRADYGELVHLDGMITSMIVCFDLDLLERVLIRDPQSFMKGEGLRATRYVLGDGLLTAEGEAHRRHRKLAAPIFTPRHIDPWAAEMAAITREGLAAWPDDGIVPVARDCYDISLRIAGVALYGTDFSNDELSRLHEATRAMDAGYRTLVLPGGERVVRHGLTGAGRRMRRGRAVVDEAIRAMIAQRRHATDIDAYKDVLSLLLSARDDDDGSQLTDAETRDEAVTLLLAGHDSTSASLAWCLAMLASHPHEQQLARAEVDAQLGRNRSATAADLRAMPRVRAFVAETMRLYPAVYSTVRRPIEPLTLDDGSVLPTDTDIVVPISAIHRDATLWDEPLEFRSERFMDPEVVRGRHRLAWMPFGAGPRICIGASFALQELGVAVATVLQEMELELPAKTRIEPQIGFLRRPRGELPIRVRRRSGADPASTIQGA